MRIGIGYDIHRLELGRPLILGGLTIPYIKGLAGHSDADAVCHAITDAMLGALALGDIGSHFPDTDAQYKGADSVKLMQVVLAKISALGWGIENLDVNIVAQAPKLRPHIDIMRARVALALGIDLDRVSIKARTNEHVGPEGREEAISTQAVVLLHRLA